MFQASVEKESISSSSVERETSSVQGRKPYTSPNLIEYGAIAAMTHGPSGTVSDGPGGGHFNP
jgi:hypothetical protein